MIGLDSETRGLVAQTLERFVTERYDPAGRLARIKAPPVDYRAEWSLLAELGVTGLAFDADDGGMGAGVTDLSHALQVLATGLVLEPVAESAVLAASLLRLTHGGWRVPAVSGTIAGECLRVVVVAGPGVPVLRLEREGTSLRLDGTAPVVPYAAQADEWLVAARQDGGGPCIVRVAPSAPGVRVDAFRLMDARPAGDIHFEGAVIDPQQILMSGEEATKALAALADLTLAVRAADAVGIMGNLLAMTREYLRTRVQFGVAIGSFQALQHRLADMHMAYVEVRALLRSFTIAIDADAPANKLQPLRSALPRIVTQAGKRIGQEAIQLHGGMGATEELVVSHCNARLQVDATLLQPWLREPVPATPEVA